MNTSDMGKFICELRKESGLTQKDLAEKLNITDKAVSKWETGRSAPDIALLSPLSDALGVSVVELLRGEKIGTEGFSKVSDEVVVRTMKNDNEKLKKAVFVVVIVMILLVLLSALSFPFYHFLNSAPVDNEAAIIKEFSAFGLLNEYAKIVKIVKKGEFYFVLLKEENCVYLGVFQENKIFNDRISFFGGTICSEPNKVAQYCSGMNYTTINAFFGYDMTDEEYSYNYRGVKCSKAIDEEYVLDVLIDINDSFTNASVIYD